MSPSVVAHGAATALTDSETFEGTVVIDALLDPITGAIVARELARLEQELFEADWAEARQRLGDAACASDLGRTPKQRRADALRCSNVRGDQLEDGLSRLDEDVHPTATSALLNA